jgi:hypothetical protein
MQPSASKTDLLLECSYPFGRDEVVSTSNEEADYGNAFHGLIGVIPAGVEEKKLPKRALIMTKAARLEKKYATQASAKDIADHVLVCHAAVHKWIKRELGSLDGWEVSQEQALIYNPWDDKTRQGALPSEDGHVYADVGPDEMPGTLDLKLWHPKEKLLYVLDYKTGRDPIGPAESGQLLTLGLATTRLHGVDRLVGGIIHTPADGLTTIQTSPISPKQLDKHRKSLRRALAMIGDGSLRPGGHCTSLYCPALAMCPSKTNALAMLKADGTALDADRVGRIHQAMELYDRLREGLRAQVKAWVVQNGPATRPDGKVLVLRESSRRTLSKSSIEEAMGKRALKVLQMLEDEGCFKESTRTELRAEPDRG